VTECNFVLSRVKKSYDLTDDLFEFESKSFPLLSAVLGSLIFKENNRIGLALDEPKIPGVPAKTLKKIKPFVRDRKKVLP